MTNDQRALVDNIYKKFQTTMIGSLARFESIFGHLWDNDSKEAEEFEDMWEYARNSILNNGNKQARSAVDDLNVFFGNNQTLKQKYQINFDKNNKGDGYEN